LGVALAFTLALSAQSTAPPPQHPATAAGAKAFLDEVNHQLLALANAASRAGWTQATYITSDTEVMAAQANEALVNAQTRYARQAARFDDVQVAPELRRQLDLLKSALTLAAPPDPKEAEEVTRLVASMESVYGRCS
jgi:peptidyl-dipeptidase A